VTPTESYTLHLLSSAGARICCVVAPDGTLVNQWVTQPYRAAHNAELANLDRGGNSLVDNDGVVHRTWGAVA
jgi:hypothetical protein